MFNYLWYTDVPENKNQEARIMNQRKVIVTKNAEETQKFAEEFGKNIQAGDIITLTGDLGAGKTTFTQGFAKGLGITNRIISPTFIISRKYEIKRKSQTIKIFYHIDLYRMVSEKDLHSIGLEEILGDKNTVVVIEWPEKMGSLLPKKRWNITIESMRENERKITIIHC